MDHQKTGSLIAERRNELGLTQKELARQLNISDRTVSKWERGAGFPDISLLEPLADALGLTLLELFRGECTPEPELQPEIEQTTRETVQKLKPEFKKAAKHLRCIRRLLVCTLIVLVFLLLHPNRNYIFSSKTLSPSQAAQICPFILITTQECDVVRQICSDPDIAPLMTEGNLLDLSSSITDRYRVLAQINGQPADRFTITIIGKSVLIDCWAGNVRYMLAAAPTESILRKTAAKYPFPYTENHPSQNPRYCLENENNTIFTTITSQRDLLAPFRLS